MYICTIFKYTIMEHRIKELIKEKGYTQQEFADLLGMSRVGLAQIVNGKPFASPDEVKGEEDNNTITCPKCGTKFKMEE